MIQSDGYRDLGEAGTLASLCIDRTAMKRRNDLVESVC
jgi:hypothetical protein